MRASEVAVDASGPEASRSGSELARAAGGDPLAFSEFYDANATQLMRFFYRRTACPETAADLTAETFATALSSLGNFRPDRGSSEAWLFGIARHLLSRYLRWRRIESRARRRLGMRTETALDETSYERIEQLVDVGRMQDVLRDGLDHLSPKLAEAVKLRVGMELPFTQVAQRLGCSEAAARARVSRALRKLADDMEVHQ